MASGPWSKLSKGNGNVEERSGSGSYSQSPQRSKNNDSTNTLAFGGYNSSTMQTMVELLCPPSQQDSSNAQASWMDFLQILVHQHAKTIVTLQDLTVEVEKLKDFRSSFINSITSDLSKPAGPPHHHLSHSHPKQDVWTSSPNNTKLIDSGFSTETKESSKKEDDDPLYSLLDLIEAKVATTSSSNAAASAAAAAASCRCKAVNNGSRTSASQLGKLDQILGFNNDLDNVILDRNVIRAILRETDSLELQRQILFGAAKVKSLESRLSNLSSGENNSSSRLASKYLALSQENEQLRFKLKEQEIQLEGTKARLRILERNSSTTQPIHSIESRERIPSTAELLALSSSSSPSRSRHLIDKRLLNSSTCEQFDGGSTANVNNKLSTEISHKQPSQTQACFSGSSPPASSAPTPTAAAAKHKVIKKESSETNNNGISNRRLSNSNLVKYSTPLSSPITSGSSRVINYNDDGYDDSITDIPTIEEETVRIRRRKSQGDLDTDPNNPNLNFHICSADKPLAHNNNNNNSTSNHISSCYISSNGEVTKTYNSAGKLIITHHNNNNHSEDSSNTSNQSGQLLTPPLRKNRSYSIHSRIPTRPQTPRKSLSSSTLSTPSPPQPLSKSSPISSISSKSSIPIAVTRLKRMANNSNANSTMTNNAVAGKKQGTNFWSQWFS